MERSHRSLFFFILLFVGLYALAQGNLFGHWFVFGHMSWLKWLLLAIGLCVICNVLSSNRRPRRRHRHDYDQEDLYSDRVYRKKRRSRQHHSETDRDIQNQLDRLQDELAQLQSKRAKQNQADADSAEQKLSELTDRIVTLEKIVTDRRYDLDEKISRL